MDFDDDFVAKDKIVKIYRNGDPVMKPFELKIQKGLTLAKIAQNLESKFDIKSSNNFRLFNYEGVELFDDDVQYLKDKSVAYASKGEEFDANSTFSEYNLVKVLGEGGFGQVLLGIHKTTGEKVAIKIVKTNVIGNAQDIDMVFREAEILKSLNHKNIVKIKNCYTLSDMKVVFVMEYLEGGELLERVEAANFFTEQQAKIYFRQIVEAMSYCHKNKLIHRDLKLENLLLASTTSDQIKVVDFGIAGVASKNNVENIDSGSLRYMAPEVLNGKTKQLTPAIDIWAMGVILYMMVVGDFPFNGATNSAISESIQEGVYEIPRDVRRRLSKDCINIIDAMFKLDPSLRLSAIDLLNHPFLCEEDITIKFMEEEQKQQAEQNSPSSIPPESQKQPISNQKQVASKPEISRLVQRTSILSPAASTGKSSPLVKKTGVTVNTKGSLTPQASSSSSSSQLKKPSDTKSGFSSALSKFSKK